MKRSYPEGVDPDDADSVMQALMSGTFDGAADPGPPLREAGRVVALTALLAGIKETLPRPCVMFIEGITMADEVKDYLGQHSVESDRDDLWGTVWPRSDGFHMSVTDETLGQLLAIAQRSSRQEVCDHITVYRHDQILLAAHDVGGDVWLSSELSAGAIERFRRIANVQ